jgi:hypothetical protein
MFLKKLRDRRCRPKKGVPSPCPWINQGESRGIYEEAFKKEVTLTGSSITGTASFTGKPQRAKKRLMPNAC